MGGAPVKPYLYILPAFAAIVVYLVYPAILTVINSFKDRSSTEWVGLQNYDDLLTDPGFQDTIFNTLLWILIVPAATVILGLAIATLADRLGPSGEKLSKTVIFLPMAISMVGAATIWRFVYYAAPAGQPQIGLMNATLGVFGVDPVAWLQQSEYHFNSLLLMVVLLWSQVGFAMVLLSAAVKGVPGDTLEAARIDGANERQIFFKVVVPQIKGTIITVFITVTHRRDEGLRHRLRDDQRQLQHQRARQRVLEPAQHQLQQRCRRGDRGDPDDRRDPDHVVPGAALQGRGGQRMTFPATTVTDTTPKVSAKKAMGNDPNPAKAGWGTKIFLTALCVLWMVPIIGTLVTSFRPLDDANGTGWWEVFTHPGRTSAT